MVKSPRKPENRVNVLIVDDQEPMRLLLAQIVAEDLRAQVTLAGTCERALRLADEKVFDVILLDLLMPGVGGFEVLKRIRASSVNKATPVVVVSILGGSIMGDDESVSAERAKALGANAVVPKPLRRAVLVAAVKEQLRVKA
jgi:putative two-component system response regulator